MPIRVEITANDADELRSLMRALAPAVFGQGLALKHVVSGDGPALASTMVSVEPMDMGDEADPNAVEDKADEDTETDVETPAKRSRGRPKGSKNAPTMPQAATPEELREKAIALAHEIFGRGPSAQKSVLELRNKFGVTKFIEVSLDRAGELLDGMEALDKATK